MAREKTAFSVPSHLPLHPLTQALMLALLLGSKLSSAATGSTNAPETPAYDAGIMEFNTDVIDAKDRSNIDVSHFARKGYVMPGEYPLTLKVNGIEVRDISVTFTAPESDPHDSQPCITPEITSLLGLKDDVQQKLIWQTHKDQQCLDPSSLPGITAQGDLGNSALRVAIPQAYLAYSAPNWDPPSRWDNGVAGVLFDYNVNGSKTYRQQGESNTLLSGSGTTGANLGPWRLRADWQAQYDKSGNQTNSSMDWTRYYMYRALPGLGAKLSMGETDLNSNLFDSFRYAGAGLETDDQMLPPNLQGYAPEVTGVARSNATVIISQQGRMIYQTQVAQGPFRIQDLSQSVAGTLDVQVKEQDGSVQNFQVDTASIPYLTRPGMVRYKMIAGRPMDWEHHVEGDPFVSTEFSWGITSGWSLLGGMMGSKNYNAIALGFGRDLLAFGALSLDFTQSRSRLPGDNTRTGGAYRLNYSKKFDDLDSQITFAGYRFAQKNFRSMSDYLEARYHQDERAPGETFNYNAGQSKELYTMNFSKQFRAARLSIYGNYSHQTYWNQPESNRYSVSASQYLDIGRWKGITVTLTGYRTEFWGSRDDGAYMTINIPWSNGGTLSYNGQTSRSGTTQTLGWYDNLDANNQYSLQAGRGYGGSNVASGYFTHYGDYSRTTLSASYSEGDYHSFAGSVQGGMTATLHGVALHPTGAPGGTRLMLDTNGVSGVPVRGSNGADQHSNLLGTAVVTGLTSYWRNSTGINVDAMSDDMEASHPITQLTLTEGAIGYRKLDVMQGRKMFAVLKFADGSSPPFGSIIYRDDHQVGVVEDGGNVWLSGIQPGAQMAVKEDNIATCKVTIPDALPAEGASLLLTCAR